MANDGDEYLRWLHQYRRKEYEKRQAQGQSLGEYIDQVHQGIHQLKDTLLQKKADRPVTRS